jgi:tetratricopeptide (TPR) repeat protein
MPHQVMISYSHQDQMVAVSVCEALEAEDVPCWLSPRDLRPELGEEESLQEAIKSSRVAVVVLSQSAVHSPIILHQVTAAVRFGIPLVLFRLGPVVLSRPLQVILSNPRWVEASSRHTDVQLRRLVEAVRSLLPSEEVPDPDLESEDYVQERIEEARLYLHYQVYDRAVLKLQEALERYPASTSAREELARVHSELGQKREAARQYQALARLYQDMGQPAKARQAAELLQELEGDATMMAESPFAALAPGDSRMERRPRGTTMPAGALGNVEFSVTAPPAIAPGDPFSITVWAHAPQERGEIMTRARLAADQATNPGPPPSLAEDVMNVRLMLHGLGGASAEQSVVWDGLVGSAPFRLKAPLEAPLGPCTVEGAVRAGASPVTRLLFEVYIHPDGAPPGAVALIPVREKKN